MKKNMGNIDRIVRTLISITFIVLFVNGTITGALGIVLIAASVIFLLTSLVSFCPIYAIFGTSTCKVEKA